MSPLLKRGGLVVLAAMALGACEFGLGTPPDTLTQPRADVTVTNDGEVLDQCPLPEEEIEVAEVGEPDPEDGAPVVSFLLESLVGVTEEPEPIFETFTDDEGRFSETITAPDRPGAFLLVAFCGEEGPLEPTTVNEDGFYFDFLEVAHTPITLSLSDDQVEDGDIVTATFTPCQDANDLGFSDPEAIPEGPLGEVQAMAEPTQEEIFTDYPDLQVFLDGELVATVAGTERYPTEPIAVPVTIAGAGEHEIKGVCTYQTFDIDEAVIADSFEMPAVEGSGLSAAAVEYPFSPDLPLPATYDEATSTAAAPVVAVAPAVENTGTEAQPVPAAPTYAG